MKKIVLLTLTLLICVCCLSSCDSLMTEIGKIASVQALDAVQPELEGLGYDEFKRYGQGDIAVFTVELKEQGVELKSEITGVIECYYENDQTGHWAYQLVIGVCAIEDGKTLVEYYSDYYANELSEGRAQIIGEGGWMININVSSLPIEQE